MTEEARTCFEILKKAARFGVTDCQLCPAYPVCPTGTVGWNNECMLETAADLIESMSAQLEQVTRERDAEMELIDKLIVILKKYPNAATNGCAYKAYSEVKKWMLDMRGVEVEG